jgi:hypothetical protein
MSTKRRVYPAILPPTVGPRCRVYGGVNPPLRRGLDAGQADQYLEVRKPAK